MKRPLTIAVKYRSVADAAKAHSALVYRFEMLRDQDGGNLSSAKGV